MKMAELKNCKNVKDYLGILTRKSHVLQDGRLYEHILNCPKCQGRLKMFGRVDNALNMIKSQVHGLDLFAKANQQTIGVLKHSLRENPAALKLENVIPSYSVKAGFSMFSRKLANIAACITIFFLVKTHTFNSIEDFQSGGDKIMEKYYQRQLGNDLANELFDS